MLFGCVSSFVLGHNAGQRMRNVRFLQIVQLFPGQIQLHRFGCSFDMVILGCAHDGSRHLRKQPCICGTRSDPNFPVLRISLPHSLLFSVLLLHLQKLPQTVVGDLIHGLIYEVRICRRHSFPLLLRDRCVGIDSEHEREEDIDDALDLLR